MRVRALAYALIGLVACTLLTGCSRKATGRAAGTADVPATEVKVLSSLMKTGPHGRRSIAGAIRNNSPGVFQYVQIEFDLYDKSGHPIGTTLAKTKNLAPGRDWDFEAPITQKDAVTFKIDDTAHY